MTWGEATASTGFDRARAVADAVLYEGYVLYPYRQSSGKNRVRWQFGVVLPRVHAEAQATVTETVSGSAESWFQQTEFLLEPAGSGVTPELHVRKWSVTSAGALARTIRRGQAPAEPADERCDLCRVAVSPEHRHVLDVDDGSLQCACLACSLLFDREAAALGKYRLVPTRRVRLERDPLLESIDVPVGVAFFVKSSREDRVVAQYPSPVGAIRWDLDVGVWAALEHRFLPLAAMARDVEALLVHTARGADEHWIVPIDDCYRLVALVRREWKGLSGGSAMWPELDRFFAELGDRSR